MRSRLVIEEPSTVASVSAASRRRSHAIASVTELVDQWINARTLAEAALDRSERAGEEANGLYPDFPTECMVFSPKLGRMRRGTEDDFPDANGRQSRALNHRREQCAAIDLAFDVPRLEEETKRAFELVGALIRRLEVTRPQSAFEAACKFGALVDYHGDGRGGFAAPEKIRAFHDDLEHLARLEAGSH